MKVELITSWDDFDQLETEWDELLLRSRAASIFLSWEWIAAWRVVIRDSVEPFVIVVRSAEGPLVGIAPLYVSRLRFLKAIEYRTLRYLADTASGAEYPDWIIDPEAESSVSKLIAEELRNTSSSWDLIWLPRVAYWTGASERLFDSAVNAGLLLHKRDSEFTYLDLPSDLTEFEGKFSAKRRQQLRRNSRNFRAMEGLELCECRREDDLKDYLDGLFELHQKRWKSVGTDGVYVRKPVFAKQFYEEFAPVAFGKGWLAVFGLKVGGVFKAIQYGFAFGDTYMQLQEGYDPAFESGAGNALRHFVIEKLIERRLRTYDFLGGYSEHKRRWRGELRLGCDILIGSPTLKTRLLFIKEIWPSGRYIDQLGPGLSDPSVGL